MPKLLSPPVAVSRLVASAPPSAIDAGRVLLVLLAAWAIAMIVPEVYRVFGSLGSFGVVVDNDGVVIDTTGPFTTPAESPAAAAGIAVGDRVDLYAMRCVPSCDSALSQLAQAHRWIGWRAGGAAR